MRIKGKVNHNKKMVPVEVEIVEGEIVVHLPKNYWDVSNKTHMITFRSDLNEVE